jgi:uncharacterized LabA/DUF88 family protein
MENTLVLIDAGFLSKLSKHFGKGKYLTYDIISLSKNLSNKHKLICKHIFYYTSPPFQGNEPSKNEIERFKKYESFKARLLKEKIISIKEGRCQRLKVNNEFVYKQKGVDALAIIDLISIPIEHKEVKTIILIANDSDFVPVVKKLENLGIKVILYTHYSKNRKSSLSRSNELLKAVSHYYELTKSDFDSSPLSNNK